MASFVLIRRYREVAFWWVASSLTLFLAFGDYTSVSKLLFHVPVYQSLRVPARWILIWSVAMPILASTVCSVMLRGGAEAERLRRSIRFVAVRMLPVVAGLCLLVMFIARWQGDRLAGAFTGDYAQPVLAGLKSAIRFGNPAIWWPLLLMVLTAWLLIRWSRTHRRSTWVLMLAVGIVDLAGVAAFVDVDTRTYSRSDIQKPPPLAEAIRQRNPQPGDRLLVPRYSASYDRPLEVLWPSTNMQHGIATFQGYGPLWPMANRLLFRFMPWGASEDILSLLRNPGLMRAMGIRFIAVRSDEERALLTAAMQPAVTEPEVAPIPDTEQLVPVRFGEDILWPIQIAASGVYELAFDAEPVAGSASRWFVRLETESGEPIGKTRSIDPVDLSIGGRQLRFLFVCPDPVGQAYVRIKSEMHQALSAGRATFGRIAGPSNLASTDADRQAAFVHLADLPDGISLYELPGSAELVRWAKMMMYPGLPIRHLQAGSADLQESAFLGADIKLHPGYSHGPAEVKYKRLAGHDLRVEVDSSGDGLLVFNESYDPGWRAIIDGEPGHIWRINAVVQGVELGEGRHEVRFVYWPRGLTMGIWGSILGIFVLTGGLIAARIYRRK